MKKLKFQKILSLFLIMTFLCAGLPCFIAEDADKDSKIDLKDAILNAQRIDSTTQTHNETREVCVSAMQVVASMKHISTSSGESDDISFLNLCFLLSTTDLEQFLIPTGIISNSSIPYTSIISAPITDPPIFS